MANLTRIKNNQITDSTILANTKIVPGSIVGSLFNANLTMTSDVTITGNLTVQGSSTYLTVASTNTYVNDPLIVLNNAFTGTNTYDLGLLFNRGNQTSSAFTWNEANDEFRLTYTSDTGTTYGALPVTSFGNLHVGNILVDYIASIGSISTSGDLTGVNGTLSGDLAVNGGDITSTSSTFNLLNSGTPTTVNAFGAATTVNIGASNSLIDLNGANIYLPNATTVYGGQSTLALLNLNVATLNAFGAATAITMGATSGTFNLRNANLALPNATTWYSGQTTLAVANEVPTTVNAFGAATSIVAGATTGTFNLRNANLYLPNATTVYSGQATVALMNQNVTTVNEFGAATSVTTGATTGTYNIRNANLYLPNASTVYSGQATVSLMNEVPTTINEFGAATSVTTGATTGTYNIRNANLYLPNAATIYSGQATVALLNTNVTTLNAFGAATSLNLGAATGVATINNALTNIVGVANVQSTLAATSTTSAALVVGGGVGVAGNVYAGRTLFATNGLVSTNVFNGSFTDGIIVDYTTGTGRISVGAADGLTIYNGGLANTALVAIDSNGNMTVTGDVAVNGATSADITTTTTSATVFNTTATTLSIGGAATTLGLGATSGTATINNATLSLPNATAITVGQTTVAFANTTATTVNAFGAATTLNFAAATGNTTIRNNLIVAGGLTLNATTPSTSTSTGALVLAGGLGVAGNAYIGQNLVVTGNLTVQGSTTTVNSTTLDVADLNITVAKGAASSAAANGAGLTVDGASATLLYTDSTSSWDLNKTTRITATTSATNNAQGALQVLGGAGIAQSLYARDINATVIGNVTPAAGTFTNLTSQGTTNLSLTTATAINNTPIGNATPSTGAFTTLSASGALTITNSTASTSTSTGALIVTGGVGIGGNLYAGGTLNITGDTTLTGDIAVNGGDLTTSASTFNLLAANATTVNAFGAATTLVVGGTTGTASLRNANIWLPNATTLDGAQTTVELFTQNATTANLLTKATTLLIGATTGTTTVRNGLTVSGATTLSSTLGVTGDTTLTGDIAVNGGDITSTASTFNLLAANATTVNAFGAATALTLGATTGLLNLRNANIYLPNATTIYSGQTSVTFMNEVPTTVSEFGAATSVTTGATTGTYNIRNANLVLPNATTIYSGQSTVSLLNTNVTTLNAFGAATTLNLGAATGTATVNNATVSLPNATNIAVGQTSITFANTVATTVNAFGAATATYIGAGTGTTTIRNSTTSLGVLYANATNISTSTATGALVVAGGVGVGSNLWVANGAVINSAQTSDNFRVYGKFATTLIYADSNTGGVVIGGANTAIQGGTTLKVNGTDAMMLPVGTTGQRPGLTGNVDAAGMMRFNSSLSILEFYDGSSWQSTQGAFTVINSDQFTGNGIANVYTLGSSATTEGVIVSINGVVQAPTLAYAVSGTTLTFTEAPAVADLIDVRRLTTTSTVSSIQTGYAKFDVDSYTANISTGSGSTTLRVSVDGGGNINLVNNSKLTYDQTGVTVGSSATTVDSFDKTMYRAAKYFISYSNEGSTAWETSEILVTHDGTSTYKVEYAKVSTTGSNIATYTTTISGNSVLLQCAGSSGTNNKVKVQATYIKV